MLVAGGLPEGSRDLVGARERVRDAIGELAPDAAAAGVTLAIEPLHPMYASDRCVVSTLGQALDIAADFDPAVVGATVDTFHIWWDPDVLASIERAGREGRIATYQVCDWKTPLAADVLLSRHYPGDGVIDFALADRAPSRRRATTATSRSRSSTRRSGPPTRSSPCSARPPGSRHPSRPHLRARVAS